MKAVHRITNASFLWNLVFVITMLVYLAGLPVTIMEPDAAVYAETSMEMYKSNNYLEIYHKGKDWLDKPHFPFWLTAFSYKIFGVSNWSYKLPAILFTLIAALYTFLFAKRYYSVKHAWISVLIFITAQHIIISNQDVRAEPYLTGLLIMSLFHLAVYLDEKKLLHLILGALGLACSMMTKGMFTIIPAAAAIGFTLLYQLKWKQIFHWQWLALVFFTFLFLFPALYGYYQQFDLHPEKTIFGEKNTSGVKFFLWTSQWGRFTNTGPIKGKGDPSYFVHTLLWAFLPWALLAFYALFQKTKDLIKRRVTTETYTYFGFMGLFLVFSASKFQLSFYLNPLFPLLAIMTAAALLSMERNRKFVKTFSVIQMVLCCIILVGLVLLNHFFFGTVPHWDTLLMLIICLTPVVFLYLYSRDFMKRILFVSALVFLAVNYYVNRDFYPALLRYQSESELADYIKGKNLSAQQFVAVDNIESITDVLLEEVIPMYRLEETTEKEVAGKYVYTTDAGLEKIRTLGLTTDTVHTFDDFHVTALTGKFINRKTRAASLQKRYVVKVVNR